MTSSKNKVNSSQARKESRILQNSGIVVSLVACAFGFPQVCLEFVSSTPAAPTFLTFILIWKCMLIINVPTQRPGLLEPITSTAIIPATNKPIAGEARLIVAISDMFPQRLSVVKFRRITPSPAATTWSTVQVKEIIVETLVNCPDWKLAQPSSTKWGSGSRAYPMLELGSGDHWSAGWARLRLATLKPKQASLSLKLMNGLWEGKNSPKKN